MAESHVVFALKNRYARTLGALHVASSDRVRLMADLAHLAAVIRIFAPETDVEAIKPIRYYTPKVARWKRTALAVLRKANRPLRARELARMVLSARGMDPSDYRLVNSIACSLQAVLGRLTAEGAVRVTGKPRQWALNK